VLRSKSEIQSPSSDSVLTPTHPRGAPAPSSGKPRLRAYMLQVVVLSNHQNGRDTHIRQLKVFGPRRYARAGCLVRIPRLF
jgi:hypothetical protein